MREYAGKLTIKSYQVDELKDILLDNDYVIQMEKLSNEEISIILYKKGEQEYEEN